jgi:hypothetical protein
MKSDRPKTDGQTAVLTWRGFVQSHFFAGLNATYFGSAGNIANLRLYFDIARNLILEAVTGLPSRCRLPTVGRELSQ